MTIKLIGAFFVFAGCGGFGFAMAAYHRREERDLQQFIIALEFMECELSCRLSPLSRLCRSASEAVTGTVSHLLKQIATELDEQAMPDVSCCVRAAMGNVPGMTRGLESLCAELGSTLGLFDLNGQLRGLRGCAARCRLALEELTRNRDSRLRSYQTLGLCAGAALAILFI